MGVPSKMGGVEGIGSPNSAGSSLSSFSMIEINEELARYLGFLSHSFYRKTKEVMRRNTNLFFVHLFLVFFETSETSCFFKLEYDWLVKDV